MNYFERIAGQINVPLLATKCVIVVGVGTVGAPVAEHLARDGVGHFLFIDGDTYEEVNRVRHILPPSYLGRNKAEAMRDYLLSEQIPGLRAEALARYVDDELSDNELDAILDKADLIVAGTGEREVQRRLGERALGLDTPAVFPALFPGGGGEVFLQTSPRRPCFRCWDGGRTVGEPIRGAEALGVEAMAVMQTAIELSLGILDPGSRYEELTIPDEDEADQTRRQLFMHLPEAPREPWPVPRRRNCPACAVGPSPLRPEAREAWEAARRRPSRAVAPPRRRRARGIQLSLISRQPSSAVANRGLVGTALLKLGTLVGALAFAVAWLGAVAVFISAVKGHENSVGVDFVGFVVSTVLLVWFVAGVAAVMGAVVNLFTDW